MSMYEYCHFVIYGQGVLFFMYLIKNYASLWLEWLSWLERWHPGRSPVRFAVRAHIWVWVQSPVGACKKATDPCIPLTSVFLSPFLPLFDQ